MIVRRLELEDLSLRVEWMNNPKVYTYMHFAVPITLDNTIKWFMRNIENEKRADLAFVENGNTVAFGGFTEINREINKAELYIFVNPDIQKGGIGTRATKKLCKYGFDELGLDKIYLLTNENNIAAQHVYTKCGFVLEGKLRNEYKASDGRMMCRMYYGLLKEEFNE